MPIFQNNAKIMITGGFDNVRSPHIRFLHEASRLGGLHVFLWSDDLLRSVHGISPKFSEAERVYFLESNRYVKHVSLIHRLDEATGLPHFDSEPPFPITWVVNEEQARESQKTFCTQNGYGYRVLTAGDLSGFPLDNPHTLPEKGSQKRVVVTGCYDWMHSGHVRFFEEASAFGELFVVVGHDANLRLLKGEGHPLFPENERRYLVQSVRFVTRALISSGQGWMDAEPEIERIRPDYYVVNDDGDKPEKSEFCARHQIEYKVLKRLPKPGLPRRESTVLRGF
ncbi:MAG: adenylyltransferase/cytidyltransferase family protein [Anaerolineae bacterium]|nr:adenylyltransferase/cytidyltransferase family protein [Anaerolineae bacterium]